MHLRFLIFHCILRTLHQQLRARHLSPRGVLRNLLQVVNPVVLSLLQVLEQVVLRAREASVGVLLEVLGLLAQRDLLKGLLRDLQRERENQVRFKQM